MIACWVSGNAQVQKGRTFWPSGSRRTPWMKVGVLTAGTPRDGNALAYRWAQALTASWNACWPAWSCCACDFPAATACWRADASALFPSWAQALSRTVVVLMARVLTSVPGPYTFLTPAAWCNFPSRWDRPTMWSGVIRLAPGPGRAITTTGSAPKASANKAWSLNALALGSIRRSTRASGCNRTRPRMLPADRRMARISSSSGQREGAVKTESPDIDSPEAGDDRAIVSVAKEERHQVLIMKRWDLGGR